MKFNRLTPIEFVRRHRFPSGKSHPIWKFKCDCGKIHEANLYLVRKGHTKSCGCLQAEVRVKNHLRHGATVGHTKTKMYSVWSNMVQRCKDPNATSYKYYGARGIRVEWSSYEDFVRDMESGWRDGLTLDRRERSGNYSKDNCQWSTVADQNRNKSNNRYFELNGKRLTLQDWSSETGIKPMTIAKRIKLGWSIEEALTTPVKR